jgi:hypothetical protein
VVAEARKPANQWAESAFMRELERQGAIMRKSLGPTIEAPFDWRRNPNAGFLASDLDPTSLTKTDVLSAASYSIGELSVPVVWSKGDDAKNPTENQKIAFVKSLLENALNSHDDLIEEALFTTSTNGFLGLLTLVPTSGQGSPGGVDASTETFWRNYATTYQADGSDIESVFTTAHNEAAKGSGSTLATKFMASGSTPHALFEGQLQGLQRYGDAAEANAGFKVLKFKMANYVFSQHGSDEVFFLNPKSFNLVVSKEYFRDRGETNEIDNANGYVTKIYSALQAITNNKSRLAVVYQA